MVTDGNLVLRYRRNVNIVKQDLYRSVGIYPWSDFLSVQSRSDVRVCEGLGDISEGSPASLDRIEIDIY